MVEVIERRLQVCPAAFWLKGQDLANHAKHMSPAFFRGHVFLNLVGEYDEADLVVVANGGEREHRGEFGGQFVLVWRTLPNWPEALRSTTSMTVSSRSSLNFLMYG